MSYTIFQAYSEKTKYSFCSIIDCGNGLLNCKYINTLQFNALISCLVVHIPVLSTPLITYIYVGDHRARKIEKFKINVNVI